MSQEKNLLQQLQNVCDLSPRARFQINAAQTQHASRRHFLRSGTGALGAALFGMGATGLNNAAHAAGGATLDFTRSPSTPLAPLPPQYAPKANRVIYIHMAGAPSQLELFDHKPVLTANDGELCPESFLEGKKFAFLSGRPKMLGSIYPFHQAGESGAWISDRLPHTEKHIDDLCFIKSMRTDQFNHAPAQIVSHTGTAQLGHPSLGAWATYGLGTLNQNLPGYIVLLSNGNPDGGKQLWSSGFLPSVYQGVQCRSQGEPVLYLDNPEGVDRLERRAVLDAISAMNQETYDEFGDEETITRISQYEMAFRMQVEASEAFDIMRESDVTRERYGATPGEASFANNCLVAKRLAERGVRFIQLFDWGWDSHGNSKQQSLDYGFKDLCQKSDRPIAALLEDLKRSGMLEDTLVVWGSEFGRTPMKQDGNNSAERYYGRDHNPFAFTQWMAGGGVKGGYTHGETDDMGYEVVKDPVEMADFHATILYLLGFDHRSLNYPYQGLKQKLTGVSHARVVSQVIA